jgi:hypothetical protein
VGDHWVALHCVGDHCVGENCGLKTFELMLGFQFVGSHEDGLYWEVLKTSTGVSAPCFARSSSARFGPFTGL